MRDEDSQDEANDEKVPLIVPKADLKEEPKQADPGKEADAKPSVDDGAGLIRRFDTESTIHKPEYASSALAASLWLARKKSSDERTMLDAIGSGNEYRLNRSARRARRIASLFKNFSNQE